MMLRFAPLAFCLALAAPVVAQTTGYGPTQQPRAITEFAAEQSYDSLLTTHAGTPTQPRINEVGLVLVIRMFRIVCLGIEGGAALDAVAPEGFVSYPEGPYYLGVGNAGDGGPRVLSPTGEVEVDEAAGHPTIWLRPRSEGMSCRIEWSFDTPPPDDTQIDMARVIEQWLPYELALVRALRPDFYAVPPTSGFSQWDRPCGDRWCPVTVNYSLPNGRISVDTTLNITDIQGARP